MKYKHSVQWVAREIHVLNVKAIEADMFKEVKIEIQARNTISM